MRVSNLNYVINNLPPQYLALFNPNAFMAANKFALSNPESDPNVSDSLLQLGYTQKGGKWQSPKLAPNEQELFKWEFTSDGRALVTPLGGKKIVPTEVQLTGRVELTEKDFNWMQQHPLAIDPIVAALAVYKLDKITDSNFPYDAYDIDANDKIIQFLLTLDPTLAPNLNLIGVDDAENCLGLALLMDTACRNDTMSPEFIQNAVNHLVSTFPSATQWIGCGVENVPSKKRNPFALRDGSIDPKEYIKYRLEQIEYILDKAKVPIYFPSPMQEGYTGNLELMQEVLGKHPRKVVAHKLREPFNELTNYFDLIILQAIAHLAYAVKTSDPRYYEQMKDYSAVRAAATKDYKPIMHTGDDRGTFFTLWKGVDELVKKIQKGEKPETYERNYFTFYRDVNISALLGNIGLNPINFIYLDLIASKYVYAKRKGNEVKASEYEKEYWRVAAPYTGYSTDSFFGENDPTRAYTWKVWLTNRMAGTLNANDGEVLPARQTSWKDGINRKILAGRHAALGAWAGAFNGEEMPIVLGKNKDLFLLSKD